MPSSAYIRGSVHVLWLIRLHIRENSAHCIRAGTLDQSMQTTLKIYQVVLDLYLFP